MESCKNKYITMNIQAANTIKRAMRFNRDRILAAIITKGFDNVSNDMKIAYRCIYDYGDDIDDCQATMGCDFDVMSYAIESSLQTPAILKILDERTIGSSKKTMRLIYQSMDSHNNIIVDVCKSSIFKRYEPLIAAICNRREHPCMRHALMTIYNTKIAEVGHIVIDMLGSKWVQYQ